MKTSSQMALVGVAWVLAALVGGVLNAASAQSIDQDTALLMRISGAEKVPRGSKRSLLIKVAEHLERDEHSAAEEAWRKATRTLRGLSRNQMQAAIDHVMWRTLSATHPDVLADAQRAAFRIGALKTIESQIERLKDAKRALRGGKPTVMVRPLIVDVSDTPDPPKLDAARSMDIDRLRDEMKAMRKERRYAKKQAKMARLRVENGLQRASRMSRRMARAWRMLNGVAMAKR